MRLREHKLIIATLVFISMFISSCMEKNLYDAEKNETPSSATFATTQEVRFVMQYAIPIGYAAGFEVYTENPIETADNGFIVLRTDIEPIAAGIVESGDFRMSKQIPGYVKELYAFSSDLFAPKLLYAKIENGTADFQPIALTSNNTKADTRTTAADKIDVEAGDFVPEIDSKFTPASEGNANIPATVLSAIKSAFPEGYKGQTVPDRYIQEATMEVKEKAELWLSPMLTGCSMTNTLGYFCYDGPKSELAGKSLTDLDEKLIVVFPFASLSDNSFFKNEADQTNIVRGDKFRLKYYDKSKKELVNEFPEGTTIVWFLWVGAYNKDNQTWNKNAQHKLYSHWDWNTCEVEEAKKPHTAYYSIRHESTDYVCFAFEDQIKTSSDRDFNDMVFLIQSNPATAIVPPVIIDDKGNEIVTQTEKRKGILAFEDNWPAAGDYDLNDVVVKYNSNTTYAFESNATYVTKTEDVFALIHSGASYRNKFSIKYNIAPAAVSSITINGVSANYRIDGNGYIVDVCPDVLGVISAYITGQNYEYNIVTEFNKNAISQTDFQKLAAPYNPYITPSAGIEVHLPMYAPTTEADSEYFFTKDDRSIPGQGIYYVGKVGSKYPWGIHLSGVESFTIPTEKLSIDNTYPGFNDWVNSGFEKYQDWYTK